MFSLLMRLPDALRPSTSSSGCLLTTPPALPRVLPLVLEISTLPLSVGKFNTSIVSWQLQIRGDEWSNRSSQVGLLDELLHRYVSMNSVALCELTAGMVEEKKETEQGGKWTYKTSGDEEASKPAYDAMALQ